MTSMNESDICKSTSLSEKSLKKILITKPAVKCLSLAHLALLLSDYPQKAGRLGK